MRKSDLPFGSEFSPSQIDLPSLLTLVARFARRSLSEASTSQGGAST